MNSVAQREHHEFINYFLSLQIFPLKRAKYGLELYFETPKTQLRRIGWVIILWTLVVAMAVDVLRSL